MKSRMKKELRLGLIVLGVGIVILTTINFLTSHNIAMFNPKGIIASAQRDLMVIEIAIMLAVLIPTILLFYFFAWRYRSPDKHVPYQEHDHSVFGELMLWAIPTIVVAILAVLNWTSAHTLDPYKPIQMAGAAPLTVQVVALNWKWLFIYPRENIASVDTIVVPQQTPLEFDLTADAPMNSFWIPQLGGQLYAMGGMVTRLHLMADTTGQYLGKATEINGEGFSSMTFNVESVTQSSFNSWVQRVKKSSQPLTLNEYKKLAQPGETYPQAYYSMVDGNLYNDIVMQYMSPAAASYLGITSESSPSQKVQVPYNQTSRGQNTSQTGGMQMQMNNMDMSSMHM